MARGIPIDPPGCPTIRTRIERHDASIVIAIDGPGDTPIERTASDLAIAATVIESWARTELETPLLVAHAISEPQSLDVNTATRPVVERVIVRASNATGRQVHLFAAAETSFASDETSWLGTHVGACVMLGPLCAAARFRFAAVMTGPGMWEHGLDRQGLELLLGVDAPFAAGRLTVTPGFGAGLGWMHTAMENVEHAGNETGGMRGEAHVTFSLAVSRQVAVDLSLTGDLTQRTHVDSWSMIPLPDEPLVLLRFGVGLHYGGL